MRSEPRRAAPLSREALSSRVVQVLSLGSRRNPDVLLVSNGDHQIVVKDFAARSCWVRNTVGRLVTAREAAAYRWLEGHPAVPRFLGFVDPLAIAVEFRPGRRISRNLIDDAGPEFLDALARAVGELHARGLAHLDLGHRSNVLVDEAGRPVLIDFASAVWFRPGGLGARWLLPWLVRYDCRAVTKWRDKLSRQRSLRASSAGGSGGVSGGGRSESRPT